MNAETMFVMGCAAMLDDEWYEKMVAEYEAMPEVLDFCDAEEIGYMDGSEGRECDPLAYGFTTVHECESYIIAYKAISELEELIDGRDDEDFIRRGC